MTNDKKLDGREIRLRRLMGDGRAVIIAIDHGLFDGPIPGMENLPATAERINPVVDAVLLAPGMIRHCGSVFAGPKRPLAVVRLNWNTVYCFKLKYTAAKSVGGYEPLDALRDVLTAGVVQVGGEERRDALDQHLWTWRDDSFLAHGTERDHHAQRQPVLLTTGDGNANGARIRFMADGASPPDLSSYERAVFLFDGHDTAQLEQAREHWKAVKAAGLAATYWQQTPERRWERKA